MSSMLIACPSCGRKLKLDDREFIGKQVRCPGCGEVFVAEVPDEPLIEVEPSSPVGSRRKRADKTGLVVAATAVLAGIIGVYFLLRSGGDRIEERGGSKPAKNDGEEGTGTPQRPVDGQEAASEENAAKADADNTSSTAGRPRNATQAVPGQPPPADSFSEEEFAGLERAPLSGQPPVSTARTPDGLDVELLARWSRLAPRDSRGEKLPFPLELLLILKGEPATEAFGYGNLIVERVRTSGGVPLVRARIGLVDSSFADRMLVTIDRETRPADRLYVPYVFDAPTARVEEISEFTGSVQLRIPEETVRGTVTDIYADELSNVDLAAAGVRVRKVKRFGFDAAAVSIPEPAMVADVEVLKPGGEPHELAFVEVERIGGERQVIVMLANEPLPGDVKLEITAHTKLKKTDVSFKFAKVPVPEPKPLAVTLEAKEFLSQFDKNAAKADARYADVMVTLAGTVERMNKRERLIVLSAPGVQHVVNCHLDRTPVDFPQAGERVTVRGEYQVYFVGEAELGECEVVERE